ncbi:MAG: hypothetical protein CSB33_02260 [Desulfobacterales bacterium]|nr:MAG: hypothetical protein CSB33_02260 [Desulfobacterales bacterium]
MRTTLSAEQYRIDALLTELVRLTKPETAGTDPASDPRPDAPHMDTEIAEAVIRTYLEPAPAIRVESPRFFGCLNEILYEYARKQYQGEKTGICMWRYIKAIPIAPVDSQDETDRRFMEQLTRIYLYSEPLSDLTCIFVPVKNQTHIDNSLKWLQTHYEDAAYPSSLLWLYALDSSLSCLFPDEIIFMGRRRADISDRLIEPDFDFEETTLLKRYSDNPLHFSRMEGRIANDEFRQVFDFLLQEHKDRCLRHEAGHRRHDMTVFGKWEQYEDILRFGVSDRPQPGSVSFSDMRASTEFLNTYGKAKYLNDIQQPFFENTKIISSRYNGRIDKFMGDNVMCVFLGEERTPGSPGAPRGLNHFFAVLELCNVLCDLIETGGFLESRLGLRNSITWGEQILRSNLGNDFMRDFTVTGETVNLAARLEHITIHELQLHNQVYFKDAIDRFQEVSQLVSVLGGQEGLNPQTQDVIRRFNLFQNLCSNLEELETVRFDIRFNESYYGRVKQFLQAAGAEQKNPEYSDIYGYEEYEIRSRHLKFYYTYYNPKGFADYERIWILPLEPVILRYLKGLTDDAGHPPLAARQDSREKMS